MAISQIRAFVWAISEVNDIIIQTADGEKRPILA